MLIYPSLVRETTKRLELGMLISTTRRNDRGATRAGRNTSPAALSYMLVLWLRVYLRYFEELFIRY